MTEPRNAGSLPVFDGPAVPQAVSLQAVQWLVRLQACDAGDAARQAWRIWRAEHPDHERAWQHVEACGLQLQGLPAPLAHGALAPRRGRRQATKLLALALFAGGSAWWLRDGQWQEWTADHRTTIGQRLALTLADGTQIHLNTASAVDVRFDGRQRLLKLVRGEVLITTAPDAQARPFLVDTREGRLRALGTRFSVRQHRGSSHVAVYEGAVEVRPRDATEAGSDAVRLLAAGEQAGFSRLAVETPQPADALATAWTAGMLVARDMPLADFIAELSRHRTGRLACDPAVARLKISGMYPLDDTDRVLDMLLRTQPVELSGMGRYWIKVQARS